MPRGRHANPDNAYNMKLHKNGKYWYASTQRASYDQKGNCIGYRHCHWGTVDKESLKFYPSRDFLYLPVRERKKFVFPPEWDISELEKALMLPAPAPVTHSILNVDDDSDIITVMSSKSYGSVWLLERISDRLGVRQDLMITFFNNQAIVDDILTVAYYIFITNYNLDRLAAHQQIFKFPSQRSLTPPDLTSLQKSITEQNRIDFIRCRAARVTDESLLAVDSTTKSGFGIRLIDLAWGKNKEGIKTAVTVEVVVYSLSDHIPVYYKTFPGNIYDGRTVDIIMADMKEAGFSNFTLIMDRAYPSVKNLDRFIQSDWKMIGCIKSGSGIPLKIIKGLKHFDFVPDGFVYSPYLDLYVSKFPVEYSVKTDDGSQKPAARLTIYLYYDPIAHSTALKKLDVGMQSIGDEIQTLIEKDSVYTANELEELEEQYDLFSLRWETVKLDISLFPDLLKEEEERKHHGPKRKSVTMYKLVSYSRNVQAMQNAKLSAGFTSLISLGLDLTPDEAMDMYGLRPEQEADFEQWKTILPCDRERNSNELAKQGASFIQFVSRIISCYLRFQWRSSVNLRKYFKSTLDMMDAMKQIRCLEYPDQHMMKMTPFIGRQLTLCQELDLQVPKGCQPGT